jgi:hypothetical protein
MENKEQDRALQTPAEANRDKHMNYPAAEEGDSNDTGNEDVEETRRKHDADSGNDSTNEILQKEKLIDPGNEHTHHSNREEGAAKDPKHDADSGGDGTGTMGSKPE